MDKELAELEKLKAIEEDRNYGLTEIDIMYFLHHLKKGNIDDPDYRKLLVNVLVNSVYLYEDDNRATIIFNASNQPPVKVDVSLLDEIKEKSGSYASPSSPPNYQCF
jgi:site-specific DNA recombinase